MKKLVGLVLACLIIAISAQSAEIHEGNNGNQSSIVKKLFAVYFDENGSLNYLSIGVTLLLLIGVFFVVCIS